MVSEWLVHNYMLVGVVLIIITSYLIIRTKNFTIISELIFVVTCVLCVLILKCCSKIKILLFRDTTGTESYDSITTQYYRGGAVSVTLWR